MGMLYGSGAVLIREMLIRWKKGWPSMLLLGMAYGIYEEGLVVRSFFDPNWMDLDNLAVYGRVGGVNWVWAEHLTIFHAVISIAASIIFIEILYPDRRTESWISKRGFAVNTIAFAAMLPIGSLMNPYNVPDIWVALSWLAIILLVIAARIFPRVKPRIQPSRVARPRRFAWTAFFAVWAHFFIVYFTAEQNSPPFLASMAILALVDLVILWLILRWNCSGSCWDDRHRLALIGGALSFFLVLGPLTTNGQYPLMYVSNPIMLVILWWIYSRVSRRMDSSQADGNFPLLRNEK